MKTETLIIRIHLSEGTIESFELRDESQIQEVRRNADPSRIFSHGRLVVAGERFKSVFVAERVLRVDLEHQDIKVWDFPGGYADIVELTQEEFRKHAHLDEPELMAKRENCTPVGDLSVSFMEMVMVGGTRFFMMLEFPVKLPAENQSYMRLVLSKGVLHMRLACGGIGIVNLANVVSYTVYPGIAQVPADTWVAERAVENAIQ
jgi:hypothetical protein